MFWRKPDSEAKRERRERDKEVDRQRGEERVIERQRQT